MSDEHYNVSFRRALVDVKLREWLELIGKINNVSLDQGRDMFRCNLNRTDTFYVSLFVKSACSFPSQVHLETKNSFQD
jgi:hypothetical protein